MPKLLLYQFARCTTGDKMYYKTNSWSYRNWQECAIKIRGKMETNTNRPAYLRSARCPAPWRQRRRSRRGARRAPGPAPARSPSPSVLTRAAASLPSLPTTSRSARNVARSEGMGEVVGRLWDPRQAGRRGIPESKRMAGTWEPGRRWW